MAGNKTKRSPTLLTSVDIFYSSMCIGIHMALDRENSALRVVLIYPGCGDDNETGSRECKYLSM
jgi:hypothetical protein